LNITIKYSQTAKGHVSNSRLWVLLSMLIRHASHHYFFNLLCLLCIVYTCVGTYQAMVQRESFIFCHYLWNSWDRGLNVFSVATTKCTGLKSAVATSVCFFVLLVSFFKLRQIFCRLPLPSYWRFFLSLTERKC